ncbi:hypothetical protein DPMN_048904 [Dreissena polymorpha]|uniref:Uncharacterized protein n=1 Tax=Dreissena polymorpha TaxID=45954 RepID=A0A9D4DAU4_DREPO|nr:hypothetical protein DPMN_048904 [Dreissena polymorpha]
MIFLPIGTIFELNRHIQETNVLTGNVFSPIMTIFKLVRDIYKIDGLKGPTTFFNRTRKNVPPPGSHVFQPTSIIFELFHDIIWMNLLTKFHEDRTITVASKEMSRPLTPCFSSKHIIETNILTKFHEDWTKNVSFRVLTSMYRLSFFNRLFTCFHYIHIEKTSPPSGGHVFPTIMTIFEPVRDIYKIHL